MLLDKKEAAKYLSICTDTLMAELGGGRLVGFKIGYRWRFDTRDLDAYVDSKRQEASLHMSAAQSGKIKPVKIAGNAKSASSVWVPGMKIQDYARKV